MGVGVESQPLSEHTRRVPPPFVTVPTLMYSRPRVSASQMAFGAALRPVPRKTPMPPVDPSRIDVTPALLTVEKLVEAALLTKPCVVTPDVALTDAADTAPLAAMVVAPLMGPASVMPPELLSMPPVTASPP